MCLCGRQIERVVFATKLEISLAAQRNTRGQRADFLTQRGNTVIQNISVRDDQGKVRTTNAVDGKIMPQQGERITKNEIIAKTLKQIDTRLFQYEVPYSQDSDWEESLSPGCRIDCKKRTFGLGRKISYI